MVINIDKIPKEGLSVSRDFEFLSVDLVEEDTAFLSPAHAECVVSKAGDEIWIKGRLTARLSFICSRCLSPFEFPVDSSFDLVYLPEELGLMKEELEKDDLGQAFYQDNQIDLREIILEQLNLTFPMKPLCSEDCEGICAVCGKVRRNGDCGCQVKGEDPRLGKLKNFVREKN
ncbi:MAG: DUF177 domain-containing protein [Candidatus Aminicenantes bacterium]|nr:DUF177 domain-containing protein [Candidatus Aminicenantes bacterium]